MRLTASVAILVLSSLSQPLFAQSDAKGALSPAAKVQSTKQLRVDTDQLRLTSKLSDSKRLELLNRARADLKLPPVSRPPASSTRVSSRVPVSPAGASIDQANSRVYVSHSQSDPDGYFAFGPATANGGGDMIKLSFPVESGKLYLLECKVRTDSNAPIQFSSQVGAPVTETVVPVDDHVIVVVRATSTRLTRVLQSKAQHWWWSACDIAPAG